YWRHHSVPHCIDFMHVEKSVAESLVRTLLNVLRKTKDGVNARLDLAELGVKPELFSMQEEDKTTLPPAGYTLTNAEKDIFCETLYNIKVPQGYCSNFFSLINLKDRKLIGLKLHDYHMLMQEFLPIAIRLIMHPAIRYAIIRFCFFCKSICSKEIRLQELDTMQAKLVVTLCLIEKFFPLSFFDIMVHLTDEHETKTDENEEGKPLSVGKSSEVSVELFQKAHLYVIQNTDELVSYIERHKQVLKTENPGKRIAFLENEHSKSFTKWLREETPPKNYKDTYDEVDEEFSTVIHHRNDNILPLIDRRDLANKSRYDYYQKDRGDSSDDSNGPSIPRVPIYGPSVQGLLDYYGYDNIKDYLSDFYFPSTDKEDTIKHNQNVKTPTLIKECVLGLPNVDTWDDILKNFRMRTPGRCADKWMNGKDYGKDNHHVFCIYSSDDSKGVSSKGPSITSIPKEGPSIARLSKEPILKKLLKWYGYDIVEDLLVAKKPIPKIIFKSPTSIKGCVLGLANVETWDNIVKKFRMRTLGRCVDKSKGKRKV
ncbi:retrovirus-related pol polyprotein from transposon TNT 1-94, partial [Tanacetum coccineum]